MSTAVKKVLLVDDEESIHRALRLSFRREPYEFLDAYDAVEAIHILEQHPEICGMICDQNMPGVPGIELLVQVRLRFPHVATLLLTGEATIELATVAVNEGRVQGFLTKPWDPEQLRDALRDMLSPELGPRGPASRAVDAVERQLRSELALPCDPETGAFIIDEDML